MKKLKQPIFYLQWILIVLSAFGFLFAIIEGFSRSFDISSKGFQIYLSLFTPYSILFTATFIVISTQLAIERLGLMNDANQNSFKASNRIIWIQIIKEFFGELKEDNPVIIKELNKQLIAIHDYLFENDYKITNSEDTQIFFDKFLKNRVRYYEEMNNKFLNISFYRDQRHSYSWEAVRYLVVVMVNIENCYPKFIIDLQDLYQKEILAFNHEIIDKKSYELNHQVFVKKKSNGISFI